MVLRIVSFGKTSCGFKYMHVHRQDGTSAAVQTNTTPSVIWFHIGYRSGFIWRPHACLQFMMKHVASYNSER
eukprot:8853271-Pyramimonas_sp.AAC.1